MAVTQNSYTGNGSTTNYAFTFPYLKSSEVKAQIDATVTTAFTLANATTVQFNTAPANGAKIKIYRETDTDSLAATFYAGSAIKSEDLNDNFTQNLHTTQEVNARYLSNLGGTMVGDMTMAEDVDIVFEGATDDAYETTLTVADPTADRVITLPDITGTVVTTGDTGTVTATMLAANSVDSSELVDGSVDPSHLASSAVTTAKIAADAVTGAKIADDQIDSEHYVDASIDTAHIADSQITTAKIAADAVTQAKIADDAVGADQLASNSVVSASIVDGTIATADIADNAITNAKMADDSVGAAELIDTSVGTAALASNAVTLAKMADNSVGTSELVNDAVSTVKLANNAVTTVKITDSNVTTAKINNDAVTQDKLADDSVGTPQLIDASVNADRLASDAVVTAKIQDNAVTSAKIAANAVTTTEIADAELTTLAGMQSGTASILAGGTALTATLAEINTVVDGKSVETTISDTDAAYPTSGAVVDYVAAQIAPIGGLEVIATEVAFPNTQPSAGVVISIADAGGIVVNGSGTSTTGRTVGGTTVTINNIASNFNSSTVDAGVSFMVSSTGSGQIYNYHKATLKEADILNLSNDINDFGNRYRVASSAPSSSLDNGDLWYDTSNAKMMVYNSSTSAWEEVSSTGDFSINTISSYSGTGGNSATFNGSAYRFVLSNPPQDAQQLLVSVNGVIQKPNSGTGQPSEGFAINGSSIIFSAAPASSSPYFIVTIGSTVAIGTPSDNTISTAKIQNLAVTGDKIATNLDLADNKKIRVGTGNDLEIYHDGNSYVTNTTANQLAVQSNDLKLRSYTDLENYLVATHNGSVDLYYNGVKTFNTITDGIQVRGTEGAAGNIYLYADEGDDYGDLWLHKANTDGKYHIQNKASGSWEDSIVASGDGSVELYYNNSKKLETTSYGFTSSGYSSIGDGSWAYLTSDSNKSAWGNEQDLQIWHDGSHGYLDNNTGWMHLLSDNFAIKDTAGGDAMIYCLHDGAVELYYDNSKKLETHTTGVVVHGNISPDNLYLGDNEKAYFGDGSDLEIYHDGSNSIINDAGTGSLKIAHGGTNHWEFHGDGILKGNDNRKIILGDGSDLQIYHDGSNSYIKDAGTGLLAINSSALNITNAAGTEDGIKFVEDGAVELYFNGTLSFTTQSYGGNVQSDGTSVYVKYKTSEGSTRGYVYANNSDEMGFLNTAGGWRLRIESDGDYAFSGSNISDRDRKDNITTVTGTSLDKITKLVPKTYNWKNLDGITPTDKTFTGFIAQEVKEHLPSLVTGTDGQKNMAVDYNGILAHAVKAITELSAEVETLKTKVAALEAK